MALLFISKIFIEVYELKSIVENLKEVFNYQGGSCILVLS